MSQGMFDPDLLKPGPSTGSNGNGDQPTGDDHLSQFLEDTLGSVLRSARESAADLMEKARRASEEEAAISRQLRDDAQREVDRMAAWSLQVEPLVQAAYQKAAAIRDRVGEAPGRVAEALSPIKDALSDMDEIMARLTDALRPPVGGSDGNGGPSGPNGGSRSYGPGDETPSEPVRERVSAVREDAGSDRSDGSDVPGGSDVPDGDGSDGSTEDLEPVEAPAMSLVSDHDDVVEPAVAELGEVEETSAVTDDDEASVVRPMAAATSTWVDAPSDDASMVAADHGAVADADPAGEGDPVDDDDALRSTTTQLRRVAEIDWHDLPSASSG